MIEILSVQVEYAGLQAYEEKDCTNLVTHLNIRFRLQKEFDCFCRVPWTSNYNDWPVLEEAILFKLLEGFKQKAK